MLVNGAVGYLTKDDASQYLLSAVQEVAAGRRGWISPKVAQMFDLPAHPTGKDTIPALTRLEMSVFGLLAEGKADLEIGLELNIAVLLLRETIHSIYRKLGVKSTLGAVLRGIQEGIL